MGLEPTSKAWEAFVLPLNYARLEKPIILLICYFQNFAKGQVKASVEVDAANPYPRLQEGPNVWANHGGLYQGINFGASSTTRFLACLT